MTVPAASAPEASELSQPNHKFFRVRDTRLQSLFANCRLLVFNHQLLVLE
jgi:hypothetical protein